MMRTATTALLMSDGAEVRPEHVPQAFSHFTWQATGGTKPVYNLQVRGRVWRAAWVVWMPTLRGTLRKGIHESRLCTHTAGRFWLCGHIRLGSCEWHERQSADSVKHIRTR